MAKDTMTKVKWLTSYQKECRWLEEMAGKGWFLENMTMGMVYKFRKGEPKRMMYEIDRFNLPKKPTLEEINHKEIFMDMATELGWKEVTHDESLTYYFCKEYEEGDINELYNEEESRLYRAKKFGNYLRKQAKSMISFVLLVSVVDLFIKLETVLLSDLRKPLEWYDWFTLIYVVGTCFFTKYLWKQADRNEKELSMTRSQWEDSVNPKLHKVKRKIVLTARGMSKMLKKEAAQGWVLRAVTPTKYFFDKSEGDPQIYTMDTKWLLNQRRKQQDKEKISENKDWYGLDADWQLQSVKDAQAKGWQYVCALENRTIIYRGDAEGTEPLNDSKYDYSLRSTSIIGSYGIYLLCCGIIGGIIGFCMGYFGIWL